MPLVMCSRLLIVTSRHRGYCGSHRPTVSWMDSLCSVSSFSSRTDVNAFVLLPICQTLSGVTGREPPNLVVPALTSMVDTDPGRLTLSAAAETCSSDAWSCR